tara:strand:+ start:4617 stop:5390 length:774 start_codon:yes stop_codon:yes gene_type:complete
MIFIYLLSFFALLPIFAYLLNQGTTNKGYILGIATIIILLCIFSFIGKFSYLGFFEEQELTNEIKDNIKNDNGISSKTLQKFEQLIEDENKIYWMQGLILEAIDSKKYNSAENLITYSERYFKSSEEKFIFYSLYRDLRDSKFPLFANATILIDFDRPPNCSNYSGLVEIFIMNGPDIPIAKINVNENTMAILNNTSSSIPGFDVSSAYLNKETVDIQFSLICKNSETEYTTEALVLLDQSEPSNTYKISSNEWLKK